MTTTLATAFLTVPPAAERCADIRRLIAEKRWTALVEAQAGLRVLAMLSSSSVPVSEHVQHSH